MNKIWDFLKKINLAPYIVVVVLTLILSWFLFRSGSENTTIETNDVAITEIKTIGKMELVKMNVKDVLEYTIKRDYLPDSKVLLVVSGEIAGCIDLTKLNPSAIKHQDSLVKIMLPKPEICYFKIDHQRSKIYNATTYFLLDNEMELTQLAYKKAESYFQSDSINQLVFKQTEENAGKILKPLLEKITKKQVELSFDKASLKN